jgi:hypothetical protein
VEDYYAEYRDQEFIDRLGGSRYFRQPLPTRRPLNEFWPRFGPQWDGLGVTDQGQILLVEAKANIPEMVTAPTQARGESALQRIQLSLREVKSFVNSRIPVDWSVSFYQYANRLAHLYWLRELNGQDAYMVNLFFLNDAEMNGPKLVEEWQAAIRLQEVFLGVRQGAQNGHPLDPWVGAYVITYSSTPMIFPSGIHHRFRPLLPPSPRRKPGPRKSSWPPPLLIRSAPRFRPTPERRERYKIGGKRLE